MPSAWLPMSRVLAEPPACRSFIMPMRAIVRVMMASWPLADTPSTGRQMHCGATFVDTSASAVPCMSVSATLLSSPPVTTMPPTIAAHTMPCIAPVDRFKCLRLNKPAVEQMGRCAEHCRADAAMDVRTRCACKTFSRTTRVGVRVRRAHPIVDALHVVQDFADADVEEEHGAFGCTNGALRAIRGPAHHPQVLLLRVGAEGDLVERFGRGIPYKEEVRRGWQHSQQVVCRQPEGAAALRKENTQPKTIMR